MNTGLNDRPLSRRHFLNTTVAAGAAFSFLPGAVARAANAANNRVVLAVAGLHSRGKELISKFGALDGVTIKYVVDVDRRDLPAAVKVAEKAQKSAPRTETDFRRVLEDKEVDALVIATPDHWHAPMAILAAKAGKHVYVEKPCSHNAREGEILVEVAAKHQRLVQMGSQRRSIGNVQQMVEELRGGAIGKVFLAHCFYSRRRAPIGFGKATPPPAELDWDLWQGPAPRTAYRDNVHPYNWHWFWNWGTGEALNNGVHLLDVARWAMQLTYPDKVSSFGGRWHDVGLDDWETPDTQEIQLQFGKDRGITWFGRSCSTYGEPGYKANGIIFFGSKGTLDYDGSASYTVYDLENKPLRSVGQDASGKSNLANSVDPGLNDTHAENFVAAIRGKAKLMAPITEGHISTVLGHLGNISHRVGRPVQTDPRTGRVLGDRKAVGYWTREYQAGWKPTV
jgi:predicted dehydrogenase